MNEQQTKSALIIHKSVLLSNGYKLPPHYIGLLNSMYLHCGNHYGYAYHTLYSRSDNEYRYVCNDCDVTVEYVG